jgi:NadR type nicotinamide-nucleotide adenylyltransferase
MLKKIAIVGPEASGKTSLALKLAKHYQSAFAEEFARAYLMEQGLSYKKEDLLKIAIGQLKLEDEAIEKGKDLVFFDTNLLVIKIWSLYKYGSVDPKIIQLHHSRTYDFHLLLRPDLIYEEDPLRENPSIEDRNELFERYFDELNKSGDEFAVIEGFGESRLKTAVKVLESKFKS